MLKFVQKDGFSCVLDQNTGSYIILPWQGTGLTSWAYNMRRMLENPTIIRPLAALMYDEISVGRTATLRRERGEKTDTLVRLGTDPYWHVGAEEWLGDLLKRLPHVLNVAVTVERKQDRFALTVLFLARWEDIRLERVSDFNEDPYRLVVVTTAPGGLGDTLKGAKGRIISFGDQYTKGNRFAVHSVKFAIDDPQ